MKEEYKDMLYKFKDGLIIGSVIGGVILSFIGIMYSIYYMFDNFFLGCLFLFISLVLFGGFVNIVIDNNN